MKTISFILIFLLSFKILNAQQKNYSKDELLFEKAYDLNELYDYEIENHFDKKTDSTFLASDEYEHIKYTLLEKAYDYYKELIDSFPNSKLYYRALNNIAFVSKQLGRDKQAESYFLKIINSNANDYEASGNEGIMSEPYSNFKNRALKQLALICIKKLDFKQALNYLDKTKKYPYHHFCGNELSAEEIYMATLYAKCYIGLNEYEKAKKVVLPHIIENGLAGNHELVEMTIQLLLKNYKASELKEKLELAFSNYKTEIEKGKEEQYERYYIEFLGEKIEIDIWDLEFLQNEQAKNDKMMEKCKRSYFYKLLEMQ